MKRIKLAIATGILMLCSSHGIIAQKRSPAHSKDWVPCHGYWVIESNNRMPKLNTFYFYNDNDSLIYTEKIEGKKINIKSKATLRKLKSLLDNSLLTSNQIKQAKEDGSLVKAILKIGKDR
ncbi:MAG: hypothetical protein ABI691_17785 [Ginsengibacter sp.]